MADSGLPTPRRQTEAGVARGLATLANGIVQGLIMKRERERQERRDAANDRREERRLKIEETLAEARLSETNNPEDRAHRERLAELRKETAMLNAQAANARAKAGKTEDANEKARLENEAKALDIRGRELDQRILEFERGDPESMSQVDRDRSKLISALTDVPAGELRGVDRILQSRLRGMEPGSDEAEQAIALAIGAAEDASPTAAGNWLMGAVAGAGGLTLDSLRQVGGDRELQLQLAQSIMNDQSVVKAFYDRVDRNQDFYFMGTPSASTE